MTVPAVAAGIGCSGDSFTSADAGGGDAAEASDALPDGGAGVGDATGDVVVTEGGALDGGGPDASIAFVQVQAVTVVDASTLVVPFKTPLRPHDAVVVAVDYAPISAALPSVGDSVGNAYVTIGGPSTTRKLMIAYALDVDGGDVAVSVKLPPAAGPTVIEGYVHEYAGVAAVGAADVGSMAVGNSTAVSSGFATTHAPRELVFGFAVADRVTVGSGFTMRSSFLDNVTEDLVATTAGPYQATGTMTAGTQWAIQMQTFAPAF